MKTRIQKADKKVLLTLSTLKSQGFLKVASKSSQISYIKVSNISLKSHSFRRFTFRGIIFRNFEFVDIDFTLNDFQVARFEVGIFRNCDFSNSDIRACNISKVNFYNCNFTSCVLNECNVNGVEFNECRFVNTYVSDSMFSNSKLINSNLERSEFLLNYYNKVIFEDMILADCTYEKQIFTNCIFYRCKIDVEYLGTLFGIKKCDLMKMDLIYKGKDSSLKNESIENIIHYIEEEYKNRKMFLSLSLFKLNYENHKEINSLLEIIDIITESIDSKFIVSKEDIIFIERIINQLQTESRFPFFIVIKFKQMLDSYQIKNKKIDSITLGALNSLKIKIISVFQEMTEQLCYSLENDMILKNSYIDKPILLKIKFLQKPKIDVPDYLLKIYDAAGFPSKAYAERIKSSEGSYIEFINTIISILISLRIFLYLINGSLRQVDGILKAVPAISSKLKHFKKNVKNRTFDVAFFSKEKKEILISTERLIHFVEKEILINQLENGINTFNIEEIKLLKIDI